MRSEAAAWALGDALSPRAGAAASARLTWVSAEGEDPRASDGLEEFVEVLVASPHQEQRVVADLVLPAALRRVSAAEVDDRSSVDFDLAGAATPCGVATAHDDAHLALPFPNSFSFDQKLRAT